MESQLSPPTGQLEMPGYSDVGYWNNRYAEEEDHPFDWLFSYAEVAQTIDFVLPDKNAIILVIGAGNAPFSPDMYSLGKYNKIVNIDLSNVVIDQMSGKYPNQLWRTMDAMQMDFADNTFPVVVDKSLIDTLMCDNRSDRTAAMVQECYRVLRPAGRYVTFSLHSVEEVKQHYDRPEFQWKVRTFRIRSERWNDHENRKQSVAHSMIVCDKAREDGTFPCDDECTCAVATTVVTGGAVGPAGSRAGRRARAEREPFVPEAFTEGEKAQGQAKAQVRARNVLRASTQRGMPCYALPEEVPGVLREDEYRTLAANAEEVNFKHALKVTPADYLEFVLYHALVGVCACELLNEGGLAVAPVPASAPVKREYFASVEDATADLCEALRQHWQHQ